MRRGRGSHAGPSGKPLDLESLRRSLDRSGVDAAYLFGSVAETAPHLLSDVDLAYLGTDAETEDRVFDEIYEALQSILGEGGFDLVPLRRAPLHIQFMIATGGTLLFARDPIAAEAFGAWAIARYIDFKPRRDEYFSTEV